jgi:hypothetical protein
MADLAEMKGCFVDMIAREPGTSIDRLVLR